MCILKIVRLYLKVHGRYSRVQRKITGIIVGRSCVNDVHCNVTYCPHFLNTKKKNVLKYTYINATRQTYPIYRIIVWLEGVLVVFHAIDNVFVEAKTKEFLAGDQWLQYEPKTFFDLLQLGMIGTLGKFWIVRQHGHGKYQHIIGQNMW